jgi:hypothetical protein
LAGTPSSQPAAVTGLTRHALRILAREGHDVPAVIERLNALVLSDGPAAVGPSFFSRCVISI